VGTPSQAALTGDAGLCLPLEFIGSGTRPVAARAVGSLVPSHGSTCTKDAGPALSLALGTQPLVATLSTCLHESLTSAGSSTLGRPTPRLVDVGPGLLESLS